jgi:hypothetical protein
MYTRLDFATNTITPTSRRHLLSARNLGRLVVFLILLTTVQMAQAQDPTPTPTPSPTPTEEELRLQEERKLLLLKKDIEEAKKAIRDAQPQPKEPPAPTATPLAGDATLSEGVRLETEIVSYNSVSRAAEEIAATIISRLTLKATDSDNKPHHAESDKPTLPPLQNIAIYDAQVVKDWRFYKALYPAFEGQVRDLINQYIDALPKKESAQKFPLNRPMRELMKTADVAGALATGTNILKSAIDLLALFRTDTKIEGKQVTVNQNALVAELLGALKRNDRSLSLYYPGMFPPRRPNCPGEAKDLEGKTIDKCSEGSTVLILIGELFSYKADAEAVIKKAQEDKEQSVQGIKPTLDDIGKLNKKLARVIELQAILVNLREALMTETDPNVIKRVNLVIARLTAEKEQLGIKEDLEARIKALKESIKDTQTAIQALDKKIETLTDLNARFQKFVDDFVKVDSNGMNALAVLVKSEDIDNALKEAGSYWVEIQSVTAGGNNRTRKNLLRYFTGPKIDHSGGVVVEYAVYDKSGAVVYSDKVSCYGGYVEPKKISGLKIDKPCLAY